MKNIRTQKKDGETIDPDFYNHIVLLSERREHDNTSLILQVQYTHKTSRHI